MSYNSQRSVLGRKHHWNLLVWHHTGRNDTVCADDHNCVLMEGSNYWGKRKFLGWVAWGRTCTACTMSWMHDAVPGYRALYRRKETLQRARAKILNSSAFAEAGNWIKLIANPWNDDVDVDEVACGSDSKAPVKSPRRTQAGATTPSSRNRLPDWGDEPFFKVSDPVTGSRFTVDRAFESVSYFWTLQEYRSKMCIGREGSRCR